MSEEPTLLIVDDRDACREVFSLWLSESYAVRTASSGKDALDTVDETVDLVLLDRNMPGLSGLEVASVLRERGYEVGILVVSAARRDFQLDSAPIDEYLQKPIDGHELGEGVKRVLESKQSESNMAVYFDTWIGTDSEDGDVSETHDQKSHA